MGMIKWTRMIKWTAIAGAMCSASVAAAQTAGWGQAKPVEQGFSFAKFWTDPLFPGFWMAWTNATAAFFVFVVGSITLMAVRELKNPGGAPRRGVLGLDTTRGDRLFISYLGSAFIFLGWLGLIGAPLWGALVLMAAWFAFVFWRV